MTRKIELLLLFTFLCVNKSAMAQSQFSGWLASFNTIKTGKKTSIHTDVQLRSADKFERVQTLLLRAGLNYHINKRLVLTAGYAFIQNHRVSGTVDGYLPEHRIWEQLLYSHTLNVVMLTHRFRLEQRFIPNASVVNDELKTNGYGYASRFRYFARSILPLKKQAVFERGFFAALQDEIFLNFGNTSDVNGKTFDQNRLYIAAGYRFSKSFDIDAGYMNQYINGRGNAFVNTHIIQVAGYLRL